MTKSSATRMPARSPQHAKRPDIFRHRSTSASRRQLLKLALFWSLQVFAVLCSLIILIQGLHELEVNLQKPLVPHIMSLCVEFIHRFPASTKILSSLGLGATILSLPFLRFTSLDAVCCSLWIGILTTYSNLFSNQLSHMDILLLRPILAAFFIALGIINMIVRERIRYQLSTGIYKRTRKYSEGSLKRKPKDAEIEGDYHLAKVNRNYEEEELIPVRTPVDTPLKMKPPPVSTEFEFSLDSLTISDGSSFNFSERYSHNPRPSAFSIFNSSSGSSSGAVNDISDPHLSTPYHRSKKSLLTPSRLEPIVNRPSQLFSCQKFSPSPLDNIEETTQILESNPSNKSTISSNERKFYKRTLMPTKRSNDDRRPPIIKKVIVINNNQSNVLVTLFLAFFVFVILVFVVLLSLPSERLQTAFSWLPPHIGNLEVLKSLSYHASESRPILVDLDDPPLTSKTDL